MSTVSVVTPSYNQSDFIEDTIISVQAQTHEPVQHIIIDGESDDGTLDVLRRYDDHIEWISEPDDGQADAINKGFDRAEGEIVGWLNSDDPYVYRSVVSEVVDVFDRTDADVLYGHAATIDANNALRRVQYVPLFDGRRLRRHCFVVQPSVFLRAHVLEENRLTPSREYSMDYEFWLDIAEEFTFRRFDALVAADRNHPDRKIIANADESMADTAALRQERGIGGTRIFRARQLLDSVALRGRRLRALPLLAELYRGTEDNFAFSLGRPPLRRAVVSQLFGRKKEL